MQLMMKNFLRFFPNAIKRPIRTECLFNILSFSVHSVEHPNRSKSSLNDISPLVHSIKQAIWAKCSLDDLVEKICRLSREDYFLAIETILFNKRDKKGKEFQIKFLLNVLSQAEGSSLVHFRGSENYQTFINKAKKKFLEASKEVAYKRTGLIFLAYLEGFKLPDTLFKQLHSHSREHLINLSPLFTPHQLDQVLKSQKFNSNSQIVSGHLKKLLPYLPAPSREKLIDPLISQVIKNIKSLNQQTRKLVSDMGEMSSYSKEGSLYELYFPYNLPEDAKSNIKISEFNCALEQFAKDTKLVIETLKTLRPFVSQLASRQHKELIQLIMQWLKGELILLSLKNILPSIEQYSLVRQHYIAKIMPKEIAIAAYPVLLDTLTALITFLPPHSRLESIALIIPLLKIKELLRQGWDDESPGRPLTSGQQEFIEKILSLKDQESIQFAAIDALRAFAPYLTPKQQLEILRPLIKELEGKPASIDENELQILRLIFPYLPFQKQKQLLAIISQQLNNASDGYVCRRLLSVFKTLIPYFNPQTVQELIKPIVLQLPKLLKGKFEIVRREALKTFKALANYLNSQQLQAHIELIFQLLEKETSHRYREARKDALATLLPFAHRLDQQKLSDLLINLLTSEKAMQEDVLLACGKLFPVFSSETRQKLIAPIAQLSTIILTEDTVSLCKAALKTLNLLLAYGNFTEYQECVEIIFKFLQGPYPNHYRETYKEALEILNHFPQKQQELKEILIQRLKKGGSNPRMLVVTTALHTYLSTQDQRELLKLYVPLLTHTDQFIRQQAHRAYKKLIPFLNPATQHEIIAPIINLIKKPANEFSEEALNLLMAFSLESIKLERNKFVEKNAAVLWVETFIRISEYLNNPNQNQQLSEASSSKRFALR